MNSRWYCLCVIAAGLLAGAAGCQQETENPLKAGAASLEQGDYDQTIVLANEAIEENNGDHSRLADAYYLRGRAYEQRPASSQKQMLSNLQVARASYVEALRHNPSSQLQTYIRASLGKVAFYQDDFQTAQQQLRLAYGELNDRELRAAALYHLGKSQQRSGQFADADQSFALLISNYPESGWSKKAQEVRGSQAFFLQLGTYSKPDVMDKAAKLVKSRKMNPVTLKDDQGRYLLRAGPYATYAEAKQIRPKIADAFPDATIVP